jgi:hypothetical protein
MLSDAFHRQNLMKYAAPFGIAQKEYSALIAGCKKQIKHEAAMAH